MATPRIGGLRIAAIVGCGISCSCTAASAHCAIVGLGGAISLMTCSGGTEGNGTGMMFDLGKGLTAYRLSNGVSGMVYLGTSSTSANAGTLPPGLTASPNGTASPALTASPNGTASRALTAPSAGTIFYLVNGSIKSAPATAADSGSHGLKIPINTPLTPPMTNVATSGLAAPTSGPVKATGAAANVTGPALGDGPQ